MRFPRGREEQEEEQEHLKEAEEGEATWPN